MKLPLQVFVYSVCSFTLIAKEVSGSPLFVKLILHYEARKTIFKAVCLVVSSYVQQGF